MANLTKGEVWVGKSFNPSANPGVDAIKGAAAAFVDTLDQYVDASSTDKALTGLIDKAMLDLLSAQMFAVKAVTWSTNSTANAQGTATNSPAPTDTPTTPETPSQPEQPSQPAAA